MASAHVARGVGLTAAAFCGYKAVELLLDFPEPCRLMLEQAREHPLVAERVGSEVRRSFFWTGRVTDKRAAVQIPVWGERGRATLVGRAVCSPREGSSTASGSVARAWDVLCLEIESPGQNPPPQSLMPEVPQASLEEMAKHAAFHRALARPSA
ncbi:hypothetical protein KFE25_009342 [Diacronema lutheri]|uniref:Uncharacterized protein n=2 Tax=Diacronema lutheri TaxID=2081491 RepID=A0A8J5XKE4_DIALT|nr:hypothetical protein KFE25_009342 [Diacronema lutheri]